MSNPEKPLFSRHEHALEKAMKSALIVALSSRLNAVSQVLFLAVLPTQNVNIHELLLNMSELTIKY